MNGVDWAIIALMAISTLISFFRGFVREAMSLAVWIAALVGARLGYHAVEPYLADLLAPGALRGAAAGLLVFVVILLVGGVINGMLGKLVRASGLGGTDRLLGLVFGLSRGGLVVISALIFVPRLVAVDENVWWRESVLIPYFLRLEEGALNLLALLRSALAQLFG